MGLLSFLSFKPSKDAFLQAFNDLDVGKFKQLAQHSKAQLLCDDDKYDVLFKVLDSYVRAHGVNHDPMWQEVYSNQHSPAFEKMQQHKKNYSAVEYENKIASVFDLCLAHDIYPSSFQRQKDLLLYPLKQKPHQGERGERLSFVGERFVHEANLHPETLDFLMNEALSEMRKSADTSVGLASYFVGVLSYLTEDQAQKWITQKMHSFDWTREFEKRLFWERAVWSLPSSMLLMLLKEHNWERNNTFLGCLKQRESTSIEVFSLIDERGCVLQSNTEGLKRMQIAMDQISHKKYYQDLNEYLQHKACIKERDLMLANIHMPNVSTKKKM